MNRDAEKAARKESGAAPAIVDLRSRVPQMDDRALTTLHENATRLKDQGTQLQRGAASDLLLVVEAEIANRSAKKVAAASPAIKKKAAAR